MSVSDHEVPLVFANAALLGLEISPEVAANARRSAAALSSAATKLAVYGSLAPGRENEHVLRPLGGVWRSGFRIAGAREQKGWGAALGYPAVTWRPGPGHIDVLVLEAPSMPEHWAALDEFEGEEYARLYVTLWQDQTPIDVAFAYVSRDSSANTIRGLIDGAS